VLEEWEVKNSSGALNRFTTASHRHKSLLIAVYTLQRPLEEEEHRGKPVAL